ncbi:MAG: PP2C family protein-serine/threonine phosphatase [Microthrixaceae bacterium]
MPWIDPFVASSPTAREIADFPWEMTPLGPLESWSDDLRSTVQVCLASTAPVLVAWGPDLVRIFNAAYAELAGEANLSGSLGVAMSYIWSDTWGEMGPVLEDLQQGTSNGAVFRRHFTRAGPDQDLERWIEYSCSRIRGQGSDSGILVMALDATDRIVTERHLICLRDLATDLLDATDLTDVCVRAARMLSAGTQSLPWAEFHLLEQEQIICIATTRERGSVRQSDETMRQVISSGQSRVIQGEAGVVDIRTGSASQASAYIAPLGFETIAGVFVAGLNPKHQLDQIYLAFVDLCSKAISAAVDAAARHSEELQTQQEISTTLQLAMLSPATDSPTVAARYVPASGGLVVGGDWYDVIDLGGGLQALTVGDCVGHDLESAAIMGQLRSASRALLIEGNTPAQVLHAMDLFAAAIDGMASTMVCAILDPTRGQITYSSAGHPPGLLLGDGRSTWLNLAAGTPLGVRFDERREAVTELADLDLVFFYSDGLVERRGESLDSGLRRLRMLTERHWADPVQQFADTVLEEMTSGGTADDVVLVAARTHTSAAPVS